jgi:transposase
MRGADEQTGALFSYLSPDAMVPKDHPLRAIRPLVNAALARLSPDFERLYAPTGRASIAPERLLRALLLQAFYSVRSERQLMEQLTYNMLFRWFVGLAMDASVWGVTVFTKNCERLLEGDIARGLLRAILLDPAVKRLLSTEHFWVDGTLIEAWAGMKSFRPKEGSDATPGPGRNGERDFRGERRSSATHTSTTDPDARLYRKAPGHAARLCYMGHLLMENRNGLVVDTETTHATGTAEREAAEGLIGEVAGTGRITLGSDKAFDVAEHVARLREMNVTPHARCPERHLPVLGHRRAHDASSRLPAR